MLVDYESRRPTAVAYPADLVQHEWEEEGGQLSHPRSRWPFKTTATPAGPVTAHGNAQKSVLGQKPKVYPGWAESQAGVLSQRMESLRAYITSDTKGRGT